MSVALVDLFSMRNNESLYPHAGQRQWLMAMKCASKNCCPSNLKQVSIIASKPSCFIGANAVMTGWVFLKSFGYAFEEFGSYDRTL